MWSTRRAGLVVSALLASGCGDNEYAGSELQIGGRPDLVAARFDAQPFEALTVFGYANHISTYHVPDFTSIDLVEHCTGSDPFSIELRAGSLEDFLQMKGPLFCDDDEMLESQSMTIHVHDAASDYNGVEYSGGGGLPTTGTGDRTLDVQSIKGVVDVIAVGSARAAIARDIDLRHGPAVAEVDLTTGLPFVGASLDLDPGDPDESPSMFVSFQTRNGAFNTSYLIPDTWQFGMFNPGLIEPGDRTYASASLDSTTRHTARAIDLSNDQLTGHVAWLPRLPPVTFSATATQATVPPIEFEHTQIQLSCSGGPGSQPIETVVESAAWLASHDANAIAFDESAPGWYPGWFAVVPERSCRFLVTNATALGVASTQTAGS